MPIEVEVSAESFNITPLINRTLSFTLPMTQATLILNYLKDNPEGLYNFEFANKLHILRYSARIFDLRQKGWDIREDFPGHYILHTEPKQLSFEASVNPAYF